MLKDALSLIPLQSLLNLSNTTGYSVLHVACSNNQSAYGQLVLNSVLEKVNERKLSLDDSDMGTKEEVNRCLIEWLD